MNSPSWLSRQQWPAEFSSRTSLRWSIAVAALSMFLTPLCARLGTWGAARLTPGPEVASVEDFAGRSGHVVIAGFGRVGRTIARILQSEQAEMVALERDGRLGQSRAARGLAGLSRRRRPARNPAQGRRASCDDVHRHGGFPDDAETMVRAVRGLRPDAPILVRARDADHADRLLSAGASFVIPDAIEAGLQLAERALGEFVTPAKRSVPASRRPAISHTAARVRSERSREFGCIPARTGPYAAPGA